MNETITVKEQLIGAAGKLYMRLGIKSVSMDDVAREMGVSKKTVYQHVNNKEELIKLVMVCDREQDVRVLETNLRESKDAIDEFLRNGRYHIRSMREISPATLHDLMKYYPQIWHKELKGHQEYFRKVMMDNLERGMEEGLYRADIAPDVIATLCTATITAVMDTSLFPGAERPISDVISQHLRYHLHGIVNQFGRDRMDAYLKQEGLD